MIKNFFKSSSKIEERAASLYGKDWVQWLNQTIQDLKNGDCDELELERLMMEIQALSRLERKTTRDLLKATLMLILKWQLFPDDRSPQEDAQMLGHVQDIAEILQESPSLRSHLEESLEETYAKAKALVALEYDQTVDAFPKDCPVTLAEVLGS